MRVLSVIAAFCLALPAFAESVHDEERLQFADGLYAREMFELAAREYESFLRDFPETDRVDLVHFRLGECYRQLGELVDAEKQFRRVYMGFPASELRLRAGYRRAELFMKIGQYGAAVELFKMVLEEEPKPEVASATLFLMGDSLLKLEKVDEARETLTAMLERYPDSAFGSYARLKLGGIYAADAGYDKALEQYRAAYENPASDRIAAEALFQQAELEFRRGNYEQSAVAYRELLSAYPDDERSGEAKLQAAWAAHNAGLYAEGLKISEDALVGLRVGDDGAPPAERAEWLYLKANCLRQLMRGDEAIAAYGELLAAFPGSRFNEAAQYETALVNFRLGRFDKAVQIAGQIAVEGELRKDVYWLLAESFASMERGDEAIQYYRLIVRDFPQSDVAADAMYRLAHHLQKQEQYKEAARYFAQIVESFPQSRLAPQALFAAGVCFSKLDLHVEAVGEWSRLVTDYPDDSLVAEALYQKAMGEIRLERDNDALVTLRMLLDRFPETSTRADARYWQGVLLRDDGKLTDAETALRAALDSNPRDELAREAEFILADVLRQMGQKDEAVKRFLPLLESPLADRFTPPLLQWMTEYLYSTDAFDEAAVPAALLAEEEREAAWQQVGWALLGRIEQARERELEAAKAYRNALAIKMNSRYAAEAALKLGQMVLERGDAVSATKLLEKAASLAVDEESLAVRARAYAGLGQAARMSGEFLPAARYFMSVAILYQDNTLVPQALYDAARSFMEGGDTNSARKATEELRQRHPDSAWLQKPELSNLLEADSVNESSEQ